MNQTRNLSWKTQLLKQKARAPPVWGSPYHVATKFSYLWRFLDQEEDVLYDSGEFQRPQLKAQYGLTGKGMFDWSARHDVTTQSGILIKWER